VVERAFEQAYQERRSAASLLARLGSAVAPQRAAEITGGQLRVRTGVSDETAAPGEKITLILDAMPLPTMHVYAPGEDGYISVEVTLTASDDFKAGEPVFPTPGTYYYEPLDETVKVYSEPFRVTQEITLGLSRDLRQRAAARETLTILGRIRYQACDDAVCYRPETLPIAWTVELRPFAR
jgi:DsbC/DsbD-like thiol-disulfide interchange protein